AFFPIFIQSDRSRAWIGLGILAFTVACLTLIYGLCLSLIVIRLADKFRQQDKWVWMLEKSAGLIMIAFAIRLALSNSA
ncbi:MAG: lysine transporter LysE, partial [Betaproteobacteria bacterium]|nr:lysine transporter LysE [Betaproteobacteria bacterium]